MSFDAHKNFAQTAVATAPSPATSGTSLTVTTGEGALLPTGTFNAVVWPAASDPTQANAEIVRATRTGDVLALVRTQEGSNNRSIIIGDKVRAALTAKSLTDIEAAIGLTEQTDASTGTINNFNLTSRQTHLRCTGAAPVYSGFTVLGSAPMAGDRIVMDCLGTTLRVLNQDTGSTAANRIITASTNGQILGFNGRMELIYDDTTDRWQEALIDPGAPIAVTFNAGDFISNVGTWVVASGDVTVFKYVQRGKLLSIFLTVNTSTVTGGPNALMVAIPGGFTPETGQQYGSLAPGYDNNVFTPVVPNTATSASTTHLRFNRSDFGAWAASTDLTWIYSPGHTVIVN